MNIFDLEEKDFRGDKLDRGGRSCRRQDTKPSRSVSLNNIWCEGRLGRRRGVAHGKRIRESANGIRVISNIRE